MEDSLIYLKEVIVDFGWPDPGHREWRLVKGIKRKNKFLQFFFGNKETELYDYGDNKPTQARVDIDIKSNYLKEKI